MWSSTPWLASLALATALALPGASSANRLPATPEVSTPSLTATAAAHPHLEGSRLAGQATMRFLGFTIYHARLWTRPGFNAGRLHEHPLLLELHYQRELRGSAIAERSLQEMQRAGGIPASQAQRWLGQMERIFPDIRSGDRLAGQNVPGEGAVFWHNGKPAGRIPDPEFARLFFGIWLAPTTSQPDLRLSLLGQDEAGRR